MKWFRLYDEITEDPKMIQLSDHEFRIWIYLLCYLNKQSLRGYCDNINPIILLLKGAIKARNNSITRTLEKLESLGMIKQNHPSLQIVNWEKRQYKSDDINEYVKKHRNITRNITEIPSETETETEKTKTKITKKEDKYISPMLGEFTNVKLSWGSLKKLESQLGKENVNELIEALSSHMASTGKVYAEHHATIYSWAVRKGLVKRGNKSDGGVNDNVFLRTVREEDERKASRRLGKRPEEVS
jgi:hypothetical protein